MKSGFIYKKSIKMKRIQKAFLIVLLPLLGFFMSSCSHSDEIPAPTDPSVTLGTAAASGEVFLNQAVEVTFVNLDVATADMTADFGDGTVLSPTSNDQVLVHRYELSGKYTIKVKAVEKSTGKVILNKQKKIQVFGIKPLTQAMEELKNSNKVWVMGHRANTSDLSIPENSISAINASVAGGVDCLEIDLQITKDGVLVVSHDAKIDAETNGSGTIANMTYAQIQQYYLKSRRNGKVSTERMPTFEEFLIASKGKIYLNIDYGSHDDIPIGDVVQMVQKHGMTEQVIFYVGTITETIAALLKFDPDIHIQPWVSICDKLDVSSHNYFVQGSYLSQSGSTNMSKCNSSDSYLMMINMLNFSGSDVSDSYLEEKYLDDLLNKFPRVKMIQTDVADQVVTSLRVKGLR